MKTLRLCLALVLAVSMLAGCQRRNNNLNTSIPATQPPVVSDGSGVLDEARDRAESYADRAEDSIESFGNEAGDTIRSGEDRLESGLTRDDDARDRTESRAGSLANSTPAMSTDFSEIGALNGEKKAWGSGGPTDDLGRPNGATSYQEKYGQYGAYFIAPSSNKIYLTFDEGYENGYTPAILDTLQERDAKALFFVTLDFVKNKPDLVSRMIEEGHVIGNHSVKHLSFPDMPLQEAAKDIMQLHDYMKSNFGYEMWLFRPPMGEFSEQTLALAQSLGYKTILWSFAYKDWLVDDQPLTVEALDTITSKSHPGAIYLLHAVSKTNSEVLGDAIDNMYELGYTVSKWDIY